MTKQEQQKLNRERKQEKIKRAEEEGVIDKATRILSAIYLLHSQSAVMYDDLDELLERHGLKLGNIKGLGTKLNKAFDKYFEGFSKLVSREQTQNWADDLTKFDELFREFAGLPTQERDTNNEEKETKNDEA